jgi:hypothetical protein
MKNIISSPEEIQKLQLRKLQQPVKISKNEALDAKLPKIATFGLENKHKKIIPIYIQHIVKSSWLKMIVTLQMN